MSEGPRRNLVRILLTACTLLLLAGRADAYIGPGAGFVLAPVFLGLLVGLLVVLVILGLPFIVLFRLIFRKKPVRGPRNRVIVVGLDGMDPGLTRKFLEEGRLPNLKALGEEGHFGPLGTATPSISPCAWSTFMTGTDASRHNIFDFITRDPCTYLPLLTSAKIAGPRRTLSIGKFRIPLGKPVLTMLRKSKPFWHVLGKHRIFSTILRIPITFPAEPFHGHLLSGMCVPDLRGTQGSFSFFTTEKADSEAAVSGFTGEEGGVTTRVSRDGDTVRGEIVGPANTLVEGGGDLTVPFTAVVDREKKTVRLTVGKTTHVLAEKTYSPWVRLEFRPGLGLKVRGIVRFYVTSIEPEFGLYVTPIQIDPEKPALPISHPFVYSTYLARKNGPFATLGLAEDTWALNERILDEEGFLGQAWSHYEEREKQLFTALETTKAGSVVTVFDTTDRIQHMFWRYLEADHPANEGKDTERFAETIPDLYARMDDLVGRVRAKVKPGDALFVISDHGFTSFRRGVNVNTWLFENGYLALKDGATTSGDWFEGIDWENTRAFSMGLTGLFLNKKGREAKGIVAPGEEAKALKAELAEKLAALVDPRTGKPVIRTLYDADVIYDGPYRGEMPDFILGYDVGYRNSWESAVGKVTDEVITDNTKSWSGDHCVDPELVPGVIFTDQAIRDDGPMLEDMAPTVLELLGVDAPGYMTGKSLVANGEDEA
ncbi:MAG: alkaline phosphatase family protein [Planctomycetota bacterium]